MIDFFEPRMVMRAIVIAEGGEGGRSLGETPEDVFVGRVMAHIGVIDIVTGEADKVGLGGQGEVSDVVEVVERDRAPEVEVREVDELEGAVEAG